MAHQANATRQATTGEMAQDLAARLTAHAYLVWFPPGRDPATFKLSGLAGDPDVEVSAEDDGWTGCHCIGRTRAEAAEVIARLPVRGHPQFRAFIRHTLIAAWDGIEVEWHYLPPHGHPADPDQVTAALLAHLAVLDGRRGGEEAPR